MRWYGVWRTEGNNRPTRIAGCPFMRTAIAVKRALQETEKRHDVRYFITKINFPVPARGPQIGGHYDQLAAMRGETSA